MNTRTIFSAVIVLFAALAPNVPHAQNVTAGGIAPPAVPAKRTTTASATDAKAGEGLFASMNCDGCHGGGAVGWVGPSLVDGRWRYGGAPEEIFSSVYYGRPKGMPAYGGVIGENGVWMIVAYLKSQTTPSVVPTTNYETTASSAPPAAAPDAGHTTETSAATPEQMLTKYGCVACHAVDHKVVGPALEDVSKKYHGQADALAHLSVKVRNGGSGVWGDIPMTPNPQVPDADLQTLVKWVLALK